MKLEETIMATEFRTEKDSTGEMQVPADAYYGASTASDAPSFGILSSKC